MIHGRNTMAKEAMFEFLRCINLEPMEWSQAVAQPLPAIPYIGEVLDKAFSKAQALIVLLTGDDLAKLDNQFVLPGEDPDTLTPQARPNVLFEAGMAIGRHPQKVILVQIGKVRPFSNIFGRYIICMDNTIDKRQDLIDSLKKVGCQVDITNNRCWTSAGNFDKCTRETDFIKDTPFFCKNRSEIPPFKNMLNKGREEIAIMGLQLGRIKYDFLTYLEECAKRGCEIKLLMMSPKDKNGKTLPWVDEVGLTHCFPVLKQDLRHGIFCLKGWLDRLSTGSQILSKIKIKLYPNIPTVSVLFIDKDTNDGFIKIESLIVGFPPSERPSFIIDRKGCPKLYEKMLSSFNKLWENGIDIRAIT